MKTKIHRFLSIGCLVATLVLAHRAFSANSDFEGQWVLSILPDGSSPTGKYPQVLTVVQKEGVLAIGINKLDGSMDTLANKKFGGTYKPSADGKTLVKEGGSAAFQLRGAKMVCNGDLGCFGRFGGEEIRRWKQAQAEAEARRAEKMDKQRKEAERKAEIVEAGVAGENYQETNEVVSQKRKTELSEGVTDLGAIAFNFIGSLSNKGPKARSFHLFPFGPEKKAVLERIRNFARANSGDATIGSIDYTKGMVSWNFVAGSGDKVNVKVNVIKQPKGTTVSPEYEFPVGARIVKKSLLKEMNFIFAEVQNMEKEIPTPEPTAVPVAPKPQPQETVPLPEMPKDVKSKAAESKSLEEVPPPPPEVPKDEKSISKDPPALSSNEISSTTKSPPENGDADEILVRKLRNINLLKKRGLLTNEEAAKRKEEIMKENGL